jgi:hypothetical protein
MSIILGRSNSTVASVAASAGFGIAGAITQPVAQSAGLAVGLANAQGYSSPIMHSVAYAAGVGDAYAVVYEFYIDSEILCVPNEPRIVFVPAQPPTDTSADVLVEAREAFAASEDRVINVPWSPRDDETKYTDQSTDTLNRKRTC